MSQPHERLADEREHESSGGKVALMLALAVALVFGVNAWAIRRSPASERTYDGLMVATKWELASEGAPAGGVIIVGDSGGNFGVNAAVLGSELGVPAVNLCTYGRFLMTGARWLLDRSVETAEAPPGLVLVIVGSQTLVKVSDGFTFAQVPVSLSTAAAGSARLDAAYLAEFAVSRAFPLFTQSVTFAALIRGKAQVVEPAKMPIAADGTASFLASNPDGIPSNVEKKVLPEIRAFQGPIPRISDRAAIERMIQDADSRGYDLVFVDGPIWEGLVDHPEQVELMRQFHDYIDAICATSERAWHLPGPQQTFVKEDMENPFHLMPPAARRFTSELGRRLKALGLPRSI
ncbi:hypothetical protein Poly30_04310 [Planctomycetes bacterium Poly30]|uniref:Uncharacterized protein n=1 Tax=Saltatorellus ferox TaxID=2528018 RepID=A0A518ELG4_9BACT|nr:hypothetical protein Poly30_04310 [Planctomycetes bacterium Poly30]